jgi:hypothetical protein
LEQNIVTCDHCGERYFSVELEVDNGGKESENARQLKDLVNVSDEHIYIKSDGGLDDDFEIVTHTMTLQMVNRICNVTVSC